MRVTDKLIYNPLYVVRNVFSRINFFAFYIFTHKPTVKFNASYG